MMMRWLLTLLCLITALVRASAQQESDRPLTSTYQIGAGTTKALSTYLSPIAHDGFSFSLGGEWSRSLRCTRIPLRQKYRAEFSMGFLGDRSGQSSMTDIQLSLGWQLTRRFSPLDRLHIGIGAGILAEGGLLYLPRNGNNPVAARVSADIALCAEIDYNCRIGKIPLKLFEQCTLPSLGVFFSPQFGQSYYEIYLGEHNGLAHCGWWGNHFGISNLAGIEMPVCGIRLRLGYGLDIRSSYVSNINTQITSHRLVLGISTDWINVTRKQAPLQ